MTELRNKTVFLGQANGPDIELIVSGNPLYATYETPSGYSTVYDDDLGLYCYAVLKDGVSVSTGVSVAGPPPPGVAPHLQESGEVRALKSMLNAQRRSGQAHLQPEESDKP